MRCRVKITKGTDEFQCTADAVPGTDICSGHRARILSEQDWPLHLYKETDGDHYVAWCGEFWRGIQIPNRAITTDPSNVTCGRCLSKAGREAPLGLPIWNNGHLLRP